MAALLCFKRVGMAFSGARASTVVALENIDLTLAAGEFLSVLGPSGCGKSTLLRLATGLELPTSGEVTYDGVPIEEPRAATAAGWSFSRTACFRGSPCAKTLRSASTMTRAAQMIGEIAEVAEIHGPHRLRGRLSENALRGHEASGRHRGTDDRRTGAIASRRALRRP